MDGMTALKERIARFQERAQKERHPHLHGFYRDAIVDALPLLDECERELERPIDMLLFCPHCGLQHIDAPDERTPDWTNPPHKSHLCHGCGHVWRPCDRATNGVAGIKTSGKNDRSPIPAENRRLREALVRIVTGLHGGDGDIEAIAEAALADKGESDADS